MPDNIIADYELGEPVTQSEFFVLYRATHLHLTGRFRAIKTPRQELPGRPLAMSLAILKPVFLNLCETAVRVAQACDGADGEDAAAARRIAFIETVHFDPNAEIQANSAAPETGVVRPYIVTEWVAGGSLADRLAQGPLTVPQAVDIVLGVLDGLHFLHSHQIVHGNIRPENILLCADGSSPRLTDAGGNRHAVGTPIRRRAAPYLSPEQLAPPREDTPPLEARCDLFSLTLVLYEMLTGKPVGRALSAARMPSILNSAAGIGFDDLILQGLQTDPEQRFPSAQAMRDRILRAASGGRVMAAPALEAMASTTQFVAPDSGSEPAPVAQMADNNQVIEPEPEPVPEPPRIVRRAGEVRMNPRDGAPMVWVPEGVLMMGSDEKEDEQPIHSVPVKGFWMYRFPVTQALYRSYMNTVNTPGAPPSVPPPGMYLRGAEHAEKPIAGVKWNEAAAYATWAGGRLPTEAEWEWAARGEAGNRYPWGDEWDQKNANTRESGLMEVTDVSKHSSGTSWCGAVDLLGNATEWCSSLYRPYPYDGEDGREDEFASGIRVRRGGSAVTAQQRVYSSCRTDPSTITGFRMVVNEE
jgi:formylglycine-generating enzyme required for sulfatase activity